MRISVIMVDGQFREHTYGAEYFGRQDHPDFEVLWVEFHSQVSPQIRDQKNVRVITLGHPPGRTYHSSLCFNRGIVEATGELLVIPDADQIVRPDFLTRIEAIHAQHDRLVVYAYRHDEVERGALANLEFEELERKCLLKNPINYGGCLTVRKKWLLEINGYEQHPIFESGFHANGLDVYTRFKNLGLAIQWTRDVKLFHPWHANTLAGAEQYVIQKELIDWRFKNLEYLAIDGIDKTKNTRTFGEAAFRKAFEEKRRHAAESANPPRRPGLIKRALRKLW
jgi:hypothetical protein